LPKNCFEATKHPIEGSIDDPYPLEDDFEDRVYLASWPFMVAFFFFFFFGPPPERSGGRFRPL
jgi:hypothetical protein